MEVVGSDGQPTSKIMEMCSNDFLVACEMAHDVYVPMSAAQISGGHVTLNVRSDQVDDQDWPHPDVIWRGWVLARAKLIWSRPICE